MNLPKNAPDWARNVPDTRRTDKGLCFGEWISVGNDGEFVVVKWMKGRNNAHIETGKWFSTRVFATRDGIRDDTVEFSRFDLDRRKAAECKEFKLLGLTDSEAERLFDIAKARTPAEKALMSKYCEAFRKLHPNELKQIAFAASDAHRVEVCARNKLISVFLGMKVPDIIVFAKAAAWVFHGVRFPGYRKNRKWKSLKRRQETNLPPILRPKIPFAHKIAA